MNEEQTSKYWLDLAAAEVIARYPDQEIVVSSGISPSAAYHIGHFREIMTADALVWAIKKAGAKATHIHVVDNFDPLRRRYDFLPEEFEQYVGQPICLVPDPFKSCADKHKTYAEHFYQEFEQYAGRMGIHPDQVIRGYEDLYKPGRMTKAIEDSLDRLDFIKEAFEKISGRELPADWTPVQLMDDSNRFHNAKASEWDQAAKTIEGVRYDDGRAKLNWRLDWPARWRELGVMVEPFSAQEHGAAGGSYDTGVVFSKEVFGYEPPIPGVRYANIHMLGDTKKMSSSTGNLITPEQALEIMPAEILRYFVVRSKAERTLYFDSGLGLYNLIEEFSQIEAAQRAGQPHQFMDAFLFAVDGTNKQVISSVPFSHMVAVYQAARSDEDLALETLERTGYETAVKNEKEAIVGEFAYVKNWLAKYAPDSVKFEVQDKLPKVELSDEQKRFLAELASGIEAEKDLSGQGMHDLVYAKAEACGLRPPQAFQAIYRVILGKDSGPKAGWFLASLDVSWLVKRLKLQA